MRAIIYPVKNISKRYDKIQFIYSSIRVQKEVKSQWKNG
jgi:hypothetical protein